MKLNPQHLTISDLIAGRLFSIPQYQRAYSWQKRQRSDLFNDLEEVAETGREHFLATVVGCLGESVEIDAVKFKKVEIVDGQQRITTLIILLKAIEKYLDVQIDAQNNAKTKLLQLLRKGDKLSLVLLQTNHDSSSIFMKYLREGDIIESSVVTASDRNLIDAIKECEKFVSDWCSDREIMSLLSIIYNDVSIIYHEINDHSLVYKVFEVLNSRGLDVKWLDKTKSQMMAAIYDHAEDGNRVDTLKEMQTIWRDIYRCLGLKASLGDEALRFAGTWRAAEQPNRILSEQDASLSLVEFAGESLVDINRSANWLKNVVAEVRKLDDNRRLKGVTRIIHARFLAIAIMLSNFEDSEKEDLMVSWERVTFRIFGLGGADSRNKIGDYVRLGFDIIRESKDYLEVKDEIINLGDGFNLDNLLSQNNFWDKCYDGWTDELRYLLFRYDEFLAEQSGEKINEMQWEKIWSVDPSKSIEHIMPQSKKPKYVHHLGNLTMLPPSVNSSLKDKKPKDKAERYLSCGLKETKNVGDTIIDTGKWNRKLVIERAKKIEAFVRSEWSD